MNQTNFGERFTLPHATKIANDFPQIETISIYIGPIWTYKNNCSSLKNFDSLKKISFQSSFKEPSPKLFTEILKNNQTIEILESSSKIFCLNSLISSDFSYEEKIPDFVFEEYINLKNLKSLRIPCK